MGCGGLQGKGAGQQSSSTPPLKLSTIYTFRELDSGIGGSVTVVPGAPHSHPGWGVRRRGREPEGCSEGLQASELRRAHLLSPSLPSSSASLHADIHPSMTATTSCFLLSGHSQAHPQDSCTPSAWAELRFGRGGWEAGVFCIRAQACLSSRLAVESWLPGCQGPEGAS